MQEFFDQIQDPNIMQQITNKANVSEEEVRRVAALGIPTLLEAMDRNAEDDRGAENLTRALNEHANDNPYEPVGFLDRFLGGGGEGERMVDHIFTGNGRQVENSMASRTGIQPDTVKRILSVLAPLVLAHMASKWSKNQRAQQDVPQQQPYPSDPQGQNQIPGGPCIEMPDLRTQPHRESVRDFTKQTRRQVEDRTGGSIFDMAKDILVGNDATEKDNGGGLLEDLLGGLFGKR
ncbi:MAG: DUF937 domain-containing protein [Peptoniphilaceae bacterium]|jgi:hypothetical protein